ncbi:MAG: hypothetical protein ACXAC5_07675 [Promethearchaeota archaeon]|jgi:uncharacterized membrane protein YkgB
MSAGKKVGFVIGFVLLIVGIISLGIVFTIPEHFQNPDTLGFEGLLFLGGFLIFFGILIIIGLVLHSAIKARREFKERNRPA